MTDKPSESQSQDPASAEGAAATGPQPEIDFSNFVLSLAATAMVQLGMVPDPESGETVTPNLLFARHTIDTLEMLREKTRGNLEADEEKLLDSMLYELHMRVVEESP